MGREEQIISERLKKLEELKKQGINPYPHKFDKKNSISECVNEKVNASVKTAGRIMSKRDLGRIIFSNLRDGTGEIQIVLQEKETPEKIKDFFKKYLDIGDFAGIEGKIFKTKTGQKSILVKKIEVLSKAILPLPEKWHGLQDKEERYRKRYLDMIMNPEVKKIFEKREKIIDTIREFLKKREFVEVEIPTLQSVYGGASATPFITHLNALDIDLFLSISPELYLKRLIVGGFDKVFTIGKSFRNEGIDAFHNPEFTMMEYYAAYQDYEYHIEFTEQLFNELKKELHLKDMVEFQGKKINLKTPFKRIKFRDLMLKEIKIDIDKENNFDKLKKAIINKNLKEVDIKGCTHYGALLDELYKRVVRQSITQPTFLTHYPVEMIALAKRNEKDPTKINSVQLLIDGVEIVKAYDELNDPVDQDNRLKEQARLLHGGDEEAMPMDEDFVNALKIGMPPTAGYGLGIDRLIMILTNQPSIRDVILFPFMKPLEENGE
ncbi:MAG: lysine--tRNA ligase [Nanoarchaeota archaeon]